MPIYQITKTYRSGFYNSHNINGVNDRVYDANDMTEYYTGLFTNGVKPNNDGNLGDGLKVAAHGGMTIKIAQGDGLFGNRFFRNNSVYLITLDNAGASTRYDCVIVRADNTDTVRDTTVYIKTLDHVPTINDLTRTSEVNEYCLAYVTITPTVYEITDVVITDTRANNNLCGLIAGAFNQFNSTELYSQFTAAFNSWFDNIKDTFVANATLIHTYYNQVVSTVVNQTSVSIGIPQYNKNTDVLIVMVEGRTFTEGVDYTIKSNGEITLTMALPVVGTKVQFQVLKSVDGSESQTVVSQLNTLINQMNVVDKKLEYTYVCNGTNDNVLIGNIIRTFLRDSTDYGSMKLNVIGTIGMTEPAYGTGTSEDPYYWFNINTGSTRKAIIDFSSCGQIAPTISNGTYNVIFHSNNNMHIIGANVVASNTANNTIVRISNTTNGVVLFENCRFYITAYQDSLIALRGTFTNCRGSVANVINNSYCFLPASNSVVKLNGGEYYAYTGDSTKQSAIVGQSGVEAVSILYGVSGPTLARTGFYQTNSLIQYVGGGMMNCTDLISELPLSVTSGISNIRGTIVKSKPNVL